MFCCEAKIIYVYYKEVHFFWIHFLIYNHQFLRTQSLKIQETTSTETACLSHKVKNCGRILKDSRKREKILPHPHTLKVIDTLYTILFAISQMRMISAIQSILCVYIVWNWANDSSYSIAIKIGLPFIFCESLMAKAVTIKLAKKVI